MTSRPRACDLQHDSTESDHTINDFHAPAPHLVLAKDKQEAVNQPAQYGRDRRPSRFILASASSLWSMIGVYSVLYVFV